MNLGTALVESARTCSEKPLIFWGEEIVTYDQIWRESQWLARHLQRDFGIKPGDRVAIWLKNRPEFVSVLFGIFFSGGVVVPVNNFLKPDEVAYILRDCGATLLISDREMSENTAKLRETITALRVL